MTDDQLSAIFHGAADTIDTSTSRLVDAAIARGRRQRRTARLVTAGSITAVVAGAAVLAVNLIPASGSSPVTAPAGHGTGTGSVAPAIVHTSAVPTTRPATPAMVAMTPQALLQTLLDQLPAGVQTSHYAGNFAASGKFPDSRFAGAQLEVDDGHGVAGVMIGIFESAAANGMTRCTSHDADCTVLSDGTTIQIDAAHEYSDGRPGPNSLSWTFVLIRPNGNALNFFEYNAPTEKGSAITRARPPFAKETVSRWLLSPAYSQTITRSRAEQAAHLFRPTDLNHR